MISIYIIRNKVNDKVYVGQSQEWLARLRTHKSMLKNGRHPNTKLQNAWNRDSTKAWESYPLAHFNTREEADEAEIFYIAWYKDLDLCYNFGDGGCNGGCGSHSEESREKLRQAFLGIPRSPETIAKMSAARRGRPSGRLGTKASPEAIEKRRKTIEAKIEAGWISPRRGKPCSPEEAERLRTCNIGRKQSEEEIRKRVEKRIGKAKRGAAFYEAFGESKTICQWANDPRCVVDRGTLKGRLQRQSWNIEEALTTPPETPPKYTAFGEDKTITEWLKDPRCTVKATTLKARLQVYKMDPELALTRPMWQKKPPQQ